MPLPLQPDALVDLHILQSDHLEREVRIDCYRPSLWKEKGPVDLLLINDGQDLPVMHFGRILDGLFQKGLVRPLLAIGIHCGEDRKNEYGMIRSADYKHRGVRAPAYRDFVFTELLPYIYQQYASYSIKNRAFAGFSLGGLSALDMAWNYPEVFSAVAVFSGSLWWRSKDPADREYNEWLHRLMHYQVAADPLRPGMRFFFECGELDETEDRNQNGVIDSIDDTIDLLRILVRKGYREGKDIRYVQLPDGRHDVATWGRAFPLFLQWYYRP